MWVDFKVTYNISIIIVISLIIQMLQKCHQKYCKIKMKVTIGDIRGTYTACSLVAFLKWDSLPFLCFKLRQVKPHSAMTSRHESGITVLI